MNKDFQFIRVTELSAILSAEVIGKKDKNLVDKIAVRTMRKLLNEVEGAITVKCGEGTLDEAPMLYIGEKLGKDNSHLKFDLAVDPIEGTKNAAYNHGPSISLLAFAKHNTMKIFPDMYMEKFFISPSLGKPISLDNGNVVAQIIDLQEKLKRKLSIVILDKPRHKEIIIELKKAGALVTTIPDGDVIAAISVAIGEFDLLYGIGGAPEGVIMAALAISSGSYFEGRLYPYEKIWGNSDEKDISFAKKEKMLMDKYQLDYQKIFHHKDIILDDKVRFCATFLTN